MAQAKIWALCVVCTETGTYMSDEDIAKKVAKVGGGHPSKTAVSQLRQRWEADAEWHPGKAAAGAAKRGPKRTFRMQKQHAVARSAMAMKKRREEPAVAAVVAACPSATLNPRTQEPYADKYILNVFRTLCYDHDPEQPWGHVTPVHKTALSPALQAMRFCWARGLLAEGTATSWYYRHCVYVDPCSTVLSPSAQTAFDEKQAALSKGKRWMSPDSRMSSRNLRVSPYVGRQCRGGDKRVWWFIVLARGKVSFPIMPDAWEQTGEGMACFVEGLEDVLNRMLRKPDKLPRVIMSDRGPGLYQSTTGHIVRAYEAGRE